MDSHIIAAWIAMAVAFVVLAKSAAVFVDSAITLANRFGIPKLVVGIVLVSLATTAPELSVSLIASIQGHPEMALGNAIGSVICDDGLALPLCGLFASGTVAIMPGIFKTSAVFLLVIQLITFGCVAHNGQLDRLEGGVLVALFVGYIAFLFHQHKRGKMEDHLEAEIPEQHKNISMGKLIMSFAGSLIGILVASEFIVVSAKTIATSFGIPEGVIAMTLVAFGTSIPEVATCVVAAKRGEGALAVGNILGADIMNICWVAGASAIAHPLALDDKQIAFMFPSMFIIVGLMLILLRHKYQLTKLKSLIMLGAYIAYLISFFAVFPPKG